MAETWLQDARKYRDTALEGWPHPRGVVVHNLYPKVLTALEAVLRLHRPYRSIEGEWVCDALPDGGDMCEACCDVYGEHMEYPCPTVQAINEALGVDDEG